jgi:CheY-like chemotaxis protein
MILHVEDEEAVAQLLSTAVGDLNLPIEVHTVSDGEQALAFLCRTGSYSGARRPDLVLLDLHLPKLDGWAVLKEIAASSELRTIPVVILSTSAPEASKQRALALGAKLYVAKPPSFDALLAEVKTICAKFLPGDEEFAQSAKV